MRHVTWGIWSHVSRSFMCKKMDVRASKLRPLQFESAADATMMCSVYNAETMSGGASVLFEVRPIIDDQLVWGEKYS